VCRHFNASTVGLATWLAFDKTRPKKTAADYDPEPCRAGMSNRRLIRSLTTPRYLSFSVRVPPRSPEHSVSSISPDPSTAKPVQPALRSLYQQTTKPFNTSHSGPEFARAHAYTHTHRYQILGQTRKLWLQSSRCTCLLTYPRCSSPPLASRSFTISSRLNSRASSSGRRVGTRKVRATASGGAFRFSFLTLLQHADKKGGEMGVFLVEYVGY